ncbi:MAG TPA: protoporphyrinogen oxidase [Candidatus Anammoximicrobium sp.]|nr:protoporphyrinogen oxidase [Candidatus Anammoximicrobium sp.]
MTDSPTSRKRAVVVGGGISGLAAAHRLHELAPDIEVLLFEAAPRLGGVLETVRQDGFLIERGADNFITNLPWGVDLCRRLGLGDQLLQTNHQHRHAFVVRRGRLRRIPEGFIIMAPSRIWPIVSTPILSPWGKLRMAWEYFVPKRQQEGDESLATFVTRRFGRETYDRLVQPLIGGIYTGDPEKLSVRATMPRFQDMERDHGSLIRAVWKQAARQRSQMQGSSGARYSMFVTLRDGISSLIDALANRLPPDSIRISTPVTRLARDPAGGWTVSVGGAQAETLHCDAVVLAPKATAASRLVADLHPQFSRTLAEIPHASCSVVSLGYRRDQISHPMDGFGFVVPHSEHRQVLSGSFSSVKYPGRAPEGGALVRAFIGGELQPELASLPDNELLTIARDELGQLLGISGEPTLVLISRYEQAMPQYYVGHGERVQQIEAGLKDLPGLFFTGNAFGGVGIPYCIHKSEKVAEQVVAQLRGEPVDA